jgi:hypothetical protein
MLLKKFIDWEKDKKTTYQKISVIITIYYRSATIYGRFCVFRSATIYGRLLIKVGMD